MLILPAYNSQFITLFESDNGYVRRHVAVDTMAIGYKDVEMIATEKTRLGMRVDMMPTLPESDPMRTLMFPGSIAGKNLI